MQVYEAPDATSYCESVPRQKVFTVDHANRALPLVSRIVRDMVRQFKKVCALEERCHIRRPSISREQQAELRRRYGVELERLRDLSDELAAVGCQLKDWRTGLVNFPAIHHGRIVELCWRPGETRVTHWREVGAGIEARKPLEMGTPEQPVTA